MLLCRRQVFKQWIGTPMRTRRTAWRDNPRPVPEGLLVTAVGDVHGCSDHLATMYRALARDVEDLAPKETCCILLGDLIDRGPGSLESLMLAADGLAAQVSTGTVRDVALVGNHDDWLVRAVFGNLTHHDAMLWARNGGIATWQDLGIRGPGSVDRLVREIRDRLPGPVRDLLAAMVPVHRIGDLVFAHAGVDPRVPFEKQCRESLMWIRAPFLEPDHWPFPFLVVHGHTVERPVRGPAGACPSHRHRHRRGHHRYPDRRRVLGREAAFRPGGEPVERRAYPLRRAPPVSLATLASIRRARACRSSSVRVASRG